MRCIILGSHAKSLQNFRGPLIKRLLEQEHEVFALAPDYDSKSRLHIWNLGAKPIDCTLTRTKINPLLDVYHTLKLTWQIRQLRPDSILCYFIKPVIFGGIASFLAKVPNRVVMLEGLGYMYTYNISDLGILERILRKMVDFLYKFSLQFQLHVIFLNQDDLDEFVGYGLVDHAKAVKLGGIGVDLDEWGSVANRPDPKVVTFTFVGRLLREKGVMEFLEAARVIKASYPEVRFILLGDVDENPGSLSAVNIVNDVNAGVIEWPGHVEIKDWLKVTSVFVLPSYREGVPRSTQEAMAMGLPVITTDVPGCRDTVVEGVNGYVIPAKDPHALAGAMQKFIDNPSTIKSMGVESRRLATQHFDECKINDRLIEILIDKCN